jgi:hypothetical protein
MGPCVFFCAFGFGVSKGASGKKGPANAHRKQSEVDSEQGGGFLGNLDENGDRSMVAYRYGTCASALIRRPLLWP